MFRSDYSLVSNSNERAVQSYANPTQDTHFIFREPFASTVDLIYGLLQREKKTASMGSLSGSSNMTCKPYALPSKRFADGRPTGIHVLPDGPLVPEPR